MSMSSCPKRWSVPNHVSFGDYAADDFLHAEIGGPLYAAQSTLPSLPLPSLQATLDTLKDSLLAVCTSSAEEESVLADLSTFSATGGALLQTLLQSRADTAHLTKTSWLQHWWNTQGYLIPRNPVVIDVSYFFQFTPDPMASTSAARAAALLHQSAVFRKAVISGSLPVESIGKKNTPLCSSAWKYMFNATRLPKKGHDGYVIHDPSLHNHIVVLRKGRVFTFDFVDDNHEPFPVMYLEQMVQSCIAQADNESVTDVCVGVLTSQDRDLWACDYAHLTEIHPTMRASLDVVESAALCLCLDHYEPVSRECTSDLLWHGATPAPNRYFDKSIQIIVSDNGQAGVLGEHSMMDGMPMVRFADYITKKSYQELVVKEVTAEELVMPQQPPTMVFEVVALDAMSRDEVLTAAIARAKTAFTKLITDQELTVVNYSAYGAGFIKKSKMSPDAYVQMCIQLATTKLFGGSAGTYEASQVRPFRHGRTETTRSCSTMSVRFCKAMAAGDDDETKEVLLRQAVGQHGKYLKLAGAGMGVDRHMFGLAMLVAPEMTAPKLFSNPVYKKAKTWRVSTSHLTHPKFDNWGWGEVVPDGVGVAYSIHKDKCVFNVTSRRETNFSKRLAHYLEESLGEVRALLESGQKGGVASKL